MANTLRIAVFACLLLFILAEDASVLGKKGGQRFKKLEARVKKLEKNMEEQAKCKACSLIEQLTQRLNEVDKAIAEMQKPGTTVAPPQSTAPPPSTVVPFTECYTYGKLTEADRRVTVDDTTRECDKPFAAGWYRFEGAAGTRMPTTPPGESKCNTQAAGWLNGYHPTVAEGKVARQVCFHWSGDTCFYKVDIEVRNCGPFYVYNLKEMDGCALRYCSTD